jgi:NAD(P)-dependent dehydrogenase (short-subunit alcohol dehydrogenase family)
MDLSGKRVVVIGGSSGIGFAVAAAAAADGASVIIGSSQQSKVDEALQRLGTMVDGTIVDVMDEPSVTRFFEGTGAFDHLVYTAGDWAHRTPGKMTNVNLDQITQVLGTRFTGALLAIKHGVSAIRPGGSIVLTDGMVAHRPVKGRPLASAMAGAIEHLTRGLAVDLAPLRVNAVCPWIIRTTVWGDDAEQKNRPMTDPLLIRRMGEPEEVAEAYLYLMKGTYTTGQVLVVDGGRSLV